MTRRVAVVLFNLGGPDTQQAVRPFLRHLFSDPAIIGLPAPLRACLAWLISAARAKTARENYQKMGGGSPILRETCDQATALENMLTRDHIEARCFPAMRYWHPFIDEVVGKVEEFAPDQTVLLPLYPQYSMTTTGSSLAEWRRSGGGDALSICCYPLAEGLARAHADLILDVWHKAGRPGGVRVLFSAHGLPERTIRSGDPYQYQVEHTVRIIVDMLDSYGFEHQTCYQSKVGPLAWIGPSTEDAIRSACADGRTIIVCPVAFVSEHIETLVELDDEYALIAARQKAVYLRSATPRTHPAFIGALADLVRSAVDQAKTPYKRLCPGQFSKCPLEW